MNIAEIVGGLFTGVSVLVAVLTYVSANLQRQADTLRELLFDCEHDFTTLYREFDSEGLVLTVGELITHPRMKVVAEGVWAARDKAESDFKDVLKGYHHDLRMAISQSVTSQFRLKEYGKAFELAMHKIESRYPLLHVFLNNIHRIMRQTARLPFNMELYDDLIKAGFLQMQKKGELVKFRGSENVLSVLYMRLLATIKSEVRRQKVNDVFAASGQLMDIFLSNYRSRSDFGLWLLSKQETKKDAQAAEQNNNITDTFKALVEMKRDELGQETYGKASRLVGKIEGFLAGPANEPEAEGAEE